MLPRLLGEALQIRLATTATGINYPPMGGVLALVDAVKQRNYLCLVELSLA